MAKLIVTREDFTKGAGFTLDVSVSVDGSNFAAIPMQGDSITYELEQGNHDLIAKGGIRATWLSTIVKVVEGTLPFAIHENQVMNIIAGMDTENEDQPKVVLLAPDTPEYAEMLAKCFPENKRTAFKFSFFILGISVCLCLLAGGDDEWWMWLMMIPGLVHLIKNIVVYILIPGLNKSKSN